MPRDNDFVAKINKIIGQRIYKLRLGKGLSRIKLGDQVNVSHQQIRHYEKGTHQISIGRLFLIAKALQTDINHFYEDIEDSEEDLVITEHQRMCLEISGNFMKITNSEHKTLINFLVKTLTPDFNK